MKKFAGLLLPLLLVGCIDDDGPTSPAAERSVFSLLGGLEVGESLELRGEDAENVFLASGDPGAEYLIVPFFASEAGLTRLQIEIGGENVEGTTGRASLAPVPGSAAAARLRRAGQRERDQDFHQRFRQEAAEALRPRIAALRSGTPRFSRAGSMPVPALGSILPLNTSTSCTPAFADIRHGRVEAISRTAIVVADTANPRQGLTQADYQYFANLFDTLINPVATRNFGEPSDIDDNDRAIIFFTEAVNELTPAGSRGYIGGFFWAGDLFPQAICPGSNEAEMFYMLTADPAGEINGNARSAQMVRESTPGTVGHEFEHLINASRRLYVNDAEDWEAGWLDEGLAHMAEELLFYASSGLAPERNLDVEDLVASEQALDAFFDYQVDNIARFWLYLERPTAESLMGVDGLETRGATWAFLRYAADHREGDEQSLWFSLVNSHYSGVENLSRVLEVDAVDLMQAWTASVYLDDNVGVAAPPRFQQPSWNFRDVVPAVINSETYPLEVLTLGADQALQLRLRGGGAAFIRVRGEAARQARITTTSGGRTPPDRLRVTVVRMR